MRRWNAVLVAMATLIATTGCNTLRIDVTDASVGRVVEERHDYWIWGAFPSDVRVDLHEACPAGTVAITESIRPADALLTLLTLTIWSPRTARYFCRSEVE